MSAPTGPTVNGVDLRTLGFVLTGAQGLPSGRTRDYVLASIAGRPGPSRSGRRGRPRERRVILQGYILGATREEAEDRRDAILWHLDGDDEKAIVFPHRPTRKLMAVLETPEVNTIAPAFTQRGLQVAIGLLASDPRLFETSTESVDLSGAAAALELGNAPIDLTITLANPGGSPVAGPLTLNLLASDDSLLAYLELGATGVSIPAGETLTVDMRRELIYLGTGADLADHHPDWLSDGDFWNPDAAAHADGPTGPYPKAELQPLGSGLTATALYAKTWL